MASNLRTRAPGLLIEESVFGLVDLHGVVRTVATAALATVAATPKIAGSENDRGTFAVIVFAFHQYGR